MDAGLRAIFLASLERDLHFASIGALDDVVPPIDWGSAERCWFDVRDGRVRVTITQLSSPVLDFNDGPSFLGRGGPVAPPRGMFGKRRIRRWP